MAEKSDLTRLEKKFDAFIEEFHTLASDVKVGNEQIKENTSDINQLQEHFYSPEKGLNIRFERLKVKCSIAQWVAGITCAAVIANLLKGLFNG